jgi:hypothetical protein
MLPATTARSSSTTTTALTNSITGESSKATTKQRRKQQAPRADIPPTYVEVVNEIQVIPNKLDNPRNLAVVTTSNDSKESRDIRKCVSSRSSKTDLTAITTPTTATLDVTTKNVTVAKNNSSRRSSKNSSEGDRSESSSGICVCGKLLKRVKELLEAKETKAKSEFDLFFVLLLFTPKKIEKDKEKFYCSPFILRNYYYAHVEG